MSRVRPLIVLCWLTAMSISGGVGARAQERAGTSPQPIPRNAEADRQGPGQDAAGRAAAEPVTPANTTLAVKPPAPAPAPAASGDRLLIFAALGLSALALVIAGGALYVSWSQTRKALEEAGLL